MTPRKASRLSVKSASRHGRGSDSSAVVPAFAGTTLKMRLCNGYLPCVRLQTSGLDARDRTGLVIVGGVAADSDGTEQNAAVLNERAAGARRYPALRQRIHRADEIGLLLGTLEQCPRSHA